MSVDTLLLQLWEERATAILRTDDEDNARRAMDAAVRGGFRIIEFTLGCPGCYGLVEEFARRDDLVVGVGTVLEPDQARRAVDAGARFIVSPVTDEAVIATAAELGVAAMPGAYTATELHRAWRAGAPLQKLFPAPANGPEYASMLRGPLPMLRLVPTSGVTPENVDDWFAAGVYAVGFVASLFDGGELRAGRFDAVEARARRCLAAARAAKRPPAVASLAPAREVTA